MVAIPFSYGHEGGCQRGLRGQPRKQALLAFRCPDWMEENRGGAVAIG